MKLDAVTLSQADVNTFIRERFVPVHIMVGQDPAGEARLGVRLIPLSVILAPDGRELDRLVGYADPAPYRAWLAQHAGSR